MGRRFAPFRFRISYSNEHAGTTHSSRFSPGKNRQKCAKNDPRKRPVSGVPISPPARPGTQPEPAAMRTGKVRDMDDDATLVQEIDVARLQADLAAANRKISELRKERDSALALLRAKEAAYE